MEYKLEIVLYGFELLCISCTAKNTLISIFFKREKGEEERNMKEAKHNASCRSLEVKKRHHFSSARMCVCLHILCVWSLLYVGNSIVLCESKASEHSTGREFMFA